VIDVRPLTVTQTSTHDLHIGAIGYESRSTFLLERGLRARKVVAFPYSHGRNAVFERNLEVAADRGVGLLPNDTLASMEAALRLELNALEDGADVQIDISSFDRRRLATIIATLWERGQAGHHTQVDFVYVPAAFAEPPVADQTEVLEAGPVLPSFAGQLRMSSIPVTAVIGLGYELERAIGVFELLEPNRVWAFMPESDSSEYDLSLRKANRLLLASINQADVLSYPVLSPANTYLRIESFVHEAKRNNRVVLVPMGPKIFALCCLLLGLGDDPTRPAVWRVGDAKLEGGADVQARGEVVGLSARF
jgi:hypothetical protein